MEKGLHACRFFFVVKDFYTASSSALGYAAANRLLDHQQATWQGLKQEFSKLLCIKAWKGRLSMGQTGCYETESYNMLGNLVKKKHNEDKNLFQRIIWSLPPTSIHVAIWPWGQILLAVRKSHLLLFNPPIKTQHRRRREKAECERGSKFVCLCVWEKERQTHRQHDNHQHEAIWVYLLHQLKDRGKITVFNGKLLQYILNRFHQFQNYFSFC